MSLITRDSASPRRRRILTAFALPCAAALPMLTHCTARAANITWDGGGSTNLWTDPNNWSGGLPNQVNDAFIGTGFASGTNLTLNAPSNISSLTINTTTGFTIRRSTPVTGIYLILFSGDLTRQNVSGVEDDHFLDIDVSLGASGTWSIAGSNTLTVRGYITELINTTPSLTKTGTGTLVLNATNGIGFNSFTYEGATNLDQGRIRLVGRGGIGQGNVNVGLGTTLELDGALPPDSPLRLTGNGVSLFPIGNDGAVKNIGGTSSWNGPVTLLSNSSVNVDSGTLSFNGAVGDGANSFLLTKFGDGDLSLTAANTYGGGTSVTNGRLIISNNSALGSAGTASIGSGATLGLQGAISVARPMLVSGAGVGSNGVIRNLADDNTITGSITLSVNSAIGVVDNTTLTLTGLVTDNGTPHSLEKLGNGTLVLNHSNNINGGVIVGDGTLRLQLATGITSATTTTVNTGASIELPGSVAVTRLVQLNGNGFSAKGALYSSGDTSWNGGIVLQSNASVGAEADDTLTIPGQISGAFTLSKVGPGRLILTNTANNFGSLNINAGVLDLSIPQAIPAAANISVIAAGAAVELTGALMTINRPLSLTGNGVADGGALHNIGGTNTWSGAVALPSAAGIAVDANTQLTVSGAISGTGALLKSGPGLLILSGNSSFNSGVLVDAGVLRLQSSGALGAGAGLQIPPDTAVEVTGDVTIPRPLIVSGTGVAGTGALHSLAGANTWSGSISLGADTSIGVDAGGTLTVSNVILDGLSSFALTKVGPGTLILTSPNQYDSGAVVNGGTLSVNSDSALGAATGPVATNNGSKLLVTGSTTTARTFALSTGSIQVAAGATLTYVGATVNGGFLRGPGTHAIGAGASFNAVTALPGTNLSQTAAATLTNFTNAGNLTNSSSLTWDGGFNTGSGMVTVNGALATQAFENDGTIIINAGGALSNSGNALVSSGGSRVTINPAGTLSLNGTTLDLHGALLVNNGTINGGTTNVFFGSLAAGTGAFGTVVVFPGGAYTPGQTLANMPAPAPIGTGLIQPLDPNQSTGTTVILNADTTANVSASDNSLVLGPVSGPGKTLTKTGGGTLVLGSLRAGALKIDGGKVQVRPGGSPSSLSVLDILTLGAGTTLDLADNDLIVHSADLPTLLSHLRTARAGGAWTGTGLTSSAAANDPRHVTTLAVLKNDDGSGQPLHPSFDNEPVKASDTLVKYTYYGDADANGIVNGDDYFHADSGFMLGGTTTWLAGDFDNNGVTNIDDFFLMDFSFANQAGPLSGAALHALPMAVPEPAALALAGALPLALRRRGRR